MDTAVQYIIYGHALAGFVSLITGFLAITTKKGGKLHLLVGKVFFWAMTIVFITAMIAGTVRFSPFLLMVGVFSYYAVYSGNRILQLKQLHKGQKATWYDWAIGLATTMFNLAMFVWGIYLATLGGSNQVYILMIVFGAFGLRSNYTNMLPFYKKPKDAGYIMPYHIGNMVGGFIAALTAFSAQSLSFLPGLVQWLWPTVALVPVIIYFTRKYQAKKATVSS